MKEKYKYGITLLEEEKHKEAYDYFEKLIQNDDHDYTAHYFRGVIEFFFFKENLQKCYLDLKCAINGGRNIRNKVYLLLCIICGNLEKYDEAIKFGELALKNPSGDDNNSLYSIIGKCYYELSKEDPKYLDDALEYFLKDVEVNSDDTVESSQIILDIYFQQGKYFECLQMIDKLQLMGVQDATLYNYKALTYLYMGGKENYQKALDAIEIALNYCEDDQILFEKAECLTGLERYSEAEEILIKLYEKVQDPSIISSLIEAYCKEKAFDKLTQEFIQKAINEDVRLKSFYANMLESQNDPSLTETATKAYCEIFKKEHTNSSLDDVVGIMIVAGKVEELVAFLQQQLTVEGLEDEVKANIYISLSRCYRYQHKSSDEVVKMINKALEYSNNYISDRLYVYCNYSDDFETSLRLAKNDYRKYKKLIPPRLISSMCLYGEKPFRKSFQPLINTINKNKLSMHHSCDRTLLGRYFEFIKKYKSAHNVYIESYEIIKDNYGDYCNCAAAFYAHSLYNGFDGEVDKKTAYDIILREISKKKLCQSNNVTFLYSYFALQNVEGFSIEFAKELLDVAFMDSLCCLDTIYLMMKCCQVTNDERFKLYHDMFYQQMKYASSREKKYYQNKIKKEGVEKVELIYPFFNNK